MSAVPSWEIPESVFEAPRRDLDEAIAGEVPVAAYPTAEAFLITALCLGGEYDPAKFGVPEKAFQSFAQVDEAARRYQSMAGNAPPLEYLHKTFPSFPQVAQVAPEVAAADVIRGYRSFRLRQGVAAALPLLTDEPSAAVDVLAGLIDSLPGTAVAPPVSAGDVGLIVPSEDEVGPRTPVPGRMLEMYTGGIAPGRLWYLGARYGVGKTWQLVRHAWAAADAGWKVHFISLEMPKVDMAERIRWQVLGTAAYHEATPKERAEFVAERFEATGGDILIHDPTSGSVTADTIRTLAGEKTLVIVDYLGLMKARSGAASVEDWRVAATITNELREVTLATGTSVLAAVQLSKAADSARKLTGAHISQTDFAGMDADLIYLIGRPSSSVRRFYLDKNRHGQDKVSWYAEFDIQQQKFKDISQEQAHMLKMADEEAEEL